MRKTKPKKGSSSMSEPLQCTSLDQLPDHVKQLLRLHWQELLQEFTAKHDGHCFLLQCTSHPEHTAHFTPPREFLRDPGRVFCHANVQGQPMSFSVADLAKTPCRIVLDVTLHGPTLCPSCHAPMSLNNPVIDLLDFAESARILGVTAVVPATRRQIRAEMRCAGCGLANPPKKCAGCCCVRYCSRGCQVNHWSVHKPVCWLLQSASMNAMKVMKEIEGSHEGHEGNEEEGSREGSEILMKSCLAKSAMI